MYTKTNGEPNKTTNGLITGIDLNLDTNHCRTGKKHQKDKRSIFMRPGGGYIFRGPTGQEFYTPPPLPKVSPLHHLHGQQMLPLLTPISKGSPLEKGGSSNSNSNTRVPSSSRIRMVLRGCLANRLTSYRSVGFPYLRTIVKPLRQLPPSEAKNLQLVPKKLLTFLGFVGQRRFTLVLAHTP